MNAKELFFEKDYLQRDNRSASCSAIRNVVYHENKDYDTICQEIVFNLADKTIDIYKHRCDNIVPYRSSIDLNLLQAINKQVEEFGWPEGNNRILTAKEMFEEKDFKLKSDRKQYLTYEREYTIIDEFTHKEKEVHELITFDKYNKRVGGSMAGFPKKYWFDSEIIPAINKQQEELGW